MVQLSYLIILHNSHAYFNFLENSLLQLLQSIPLHKYFQHDRVSAYFRRNVRTWLNENYPKMWIDQRCTLAIAITRSIDYRPIDYYLEFVNSSEELIESINTAANEVRLNQY